MTILSLISKYFRVVDFGSKEIFTLCSGSNGNDLPWFIYLKIYNRLGWNCLEKMKCGFLETVVPLVVRSCLSRSAWSSSCFVVEGEFSAIAILMPLLHHQRLNPLKPYDQLNVLFNKLPWSWGRFSTAVEK